MASISISKENIKYQNIWQNSANISFSVDYFEAPASSPTSGTLTSYTEYSNSAASNTITVNGVSVFGNSCTVTGLTAGSFNTITAVLTATYTETSRTYTRSEIKNDKGQVTGYTSWSLASTQTSSPITIGTVSDTVGIYTRPESFSFNITSNIIQSPGGLTIDKWNNFCDAAGERQSWVEQANKYNAYNNKKFTSGLSDEQRRIRASLYNYMANAVGLSYNVSAGDPITKKHFNDLAARITSV